MLKNRLLAIADDLTGALETGAQLAEDGIGCTVSVNGAVRDSRALVVNAATRHLQVNAVATRIRSTIEATHAYGPLPNVYLKTDSTLRGPIAESIAALLTAFPERKVLYAPAYPVMGRTVRNGSLFVDGVPLADTEFSRDALNPVKQSSAVGLLEGSCGGPPEQTQNLLLRPECRVVVIDGCSDDDLNDVAKHLRAAQSFISVIVAGTAGFVRPWARSLDWTREPPPPRPVARSGLIVCGSCHPRSRSQVLEAVRSGFPLFVVSPGTAAGVVAAAFEHRAWAILMTDPVISGAPLEMASRCGDLVRDIVSRVTLDVLAVFGGDTALSILDALACPLAYPYGELLPGVPVARAVGERDYMLVTKAGGFGKQDVIEQIVKKLESGS